MTYFPFFTDIEGKTFLIVGGGKVAAEKVSRLRAFTNRIVVISENFTAPAESFADAELIKKRFEDADTGRADYCISATDDRALNRHISELCKEKGIPVNVVDDKELCTFIFPALVKRGDLVVGVTTSGKSPAYASRLRKDIEKILPDDIDEILRQMGELREMPLSAEERKKRLSELLASGCAADTDERSKADPEK